MWSLWYLQREIIAFSISINLWPQALEWKDLQTEKEPSTWSELQRNRVCLCFISILFWHFAVSERDRLIRLERSKNPTGLCFFFRVAIERSLSCRLLGATVCSIQLTYRLSCFMWGPLHSVVPLFQDAAGIDTDISLFHSSFIGKEHVPDR